MKITYSAWQCSALDRRDLSITVGSEVFVMFASAVIMPVLYCTVLYYQLYAVQCCTAAWTQCSAVQCTTAQLVLAVDGVEWIAQCIR